MRVRSSADCFAAVGMVRFAGVGVFVLVLLASVLMSGVARADQSGTYLTEAVAYTKCMEDVSQRHSSGADGGTMGQCLYSAGTIFAAIQCASPGYDSGPASGTYTINGYYGHYYWCVPRECPAGSSAGVYVGQVPPRATDFGGCCATWNQAGAVTYGAQTWQEYTGQRTGEFCSEKYSESNAPPSSPASDKLPDKICDSGQLSCYNPKTGDACYVTEFGEQVCVNTKSPPPGGCISGATGAVCIGKDGQAAPAPPDPPVPPGKAPDSTQTGSETSGANTTNNFTQNNYSGTSPGGSSDSTQSNANGGGNSDPQGKGKGTDANGKCSDGSVPTASGCSGTYTDNGCDAPPQCFGDAVLCGSARELHAIKCNTAPASGGSSGGTDDPGSGNGIDGPPASSVANSVELGDAVNNIDASGFGFARSCPLHDLSFSVMGKSVTVPLSDKCTYLDWVGYLVLAMAYLGAAKIIGGVK